MTPLRSAAFAIPGDIETLTGGYIYERRLLLGLRALGHDVEHIELPASFPDPSAADMADAVGRLAAIAPDRPLILDGLVFGAIEGLESVSAPIVAMIHHPLALETGLSPERRAHLYATERRNLGHARHVLAPSRHTAGILEAQYGVAPERITIAPPGSERPTLASAPVDPPLILSVGLQHPRKGHDILLRALAGITDLRWQAVIVGRAHDPGHAAELADMVSDLGLGSRVLMAGTIGQDALERYYSSATLFALATRYEGYGIVFDEALRWGVPIVSCDAGAVSDTVPQAAGILTPPDDPATFGAALRRLLESTTLRASLSRAASAAGAKLPGWSDTAKIASRVLNTLP
ncbi:MAG: glycosyltransferase family 4 protein [Pseudomonadota bacterium]